MLESKLLNATETAADLLLPVTEPQLSVNSTSIATGCPMLTDRVCWEPESVIFNDVGEHPAVASRGTSLSVIPDVIAGVAPAEEVTANRLMFAVEPSENCKLMVPW